MGGECSRGASMHLLGSRHGDSDRKQGRGLSEPADFEVPVGTPEACKGDGWAQCWT